MDTFNSKNALLIGNGVNLLDSSQSVFWGELLNSLKDRFNIEIEIDNEFKPFPLGFEEMLHLKSGNSSLDSKLKNLKREIRRIIQDQIRGKNGFNNYHEKLVRLGYDDILTTNYDYALELSGDSDFEIHKRKYALNRLESRFSLRRGYHVPSIRCNIWHLHGELSDARNLSLDSKYYHEESILIGYEHYAAYLENIQKNIKGKKGNREIDNQSLNYRLKYRTTGSFWTDIFFTHNIDIVGLGLDFSENHLWWLLNQRASMIRKNQDSRENPESVIVNNEIRFYYPDKEDDYTIRVNEKESFQKFIKKVNLFNKSKAIADVLKSFKVLAMPIKCKSYKSFYDHYIMLKQDELMIRNDISSF